MRLIHSRLKWEMMQLHWKTILIRVKTYPSYDSPIIYLHVYSNIYDENKCPHPSLLLNVFSIFSHRIKKIRNVNHLVVKHIKVYKCNREVFSDKNWFVYIHKPRWFSATLFSVKNSFRKRRLYDSIFMKL